jgi:selenobiotic family peptide radical SAM maturase
VVDPGANNVQLHGKSSEMRVMPYQQIEKIFPVCSSILGSERWETLMASPETLHLQSFQKTLSQVGGPGLPEYLSELARLEWALSETSDSNAIIPHEVEHTTINPTLQVLCLSWKNLTFLLGRAGKASPEPEPGEEWVLIWREPLTNKPRSNPASNDDLLALKIVADGIDPSEAARGGKVSVGLIDRAIDNAVHNGILLSPKSLIRRTASCFPADANTDERFLSSYSFTLQWHVTQACDLHCRHCYDRSARPTVPLGQAIRILDDLRSFCRNKRVMGAVSFTGGNPLLYPHFTHLYREAAERGFSLSILGNPCPQDQLEELIAVHEPSHFQVSLEGLPEHDDYIRGQGHFARVTELLKVLRKLRVYSMVMLTLTKDNMDQVIPLAGMLRDMADRFHFNRLSMVGEGANLRLPDKKEYAAFLESYSEASKKNPIMGLKDNLINILRYRKGQELFGGCAGYGCGAAFNFLALLPDGEVHACRKFPSPVGNVYQQSIAEIYDSPAARRYRSGCRACSACPVRPACGGCLASAYSHGLNIFEEKDPFCFIDTYSSGD